ncbi:MAG: hypothetical protein IT479_13095 [Xanthomonadales bacterium]|nr:hypothetical protein [Xanthomonadales bacterium]MCC6594192.1 hypothetical protein [Xanthomonadales bacterium]MCE7929809.1 hypothetical protein [Xanthomonadales bacterium PRO6]
MSVSTSGPRLRLIEENPSARRRLRLIVALLWALSLAGTWLWMRQTLAPQFGEVARELAQARRALVVAETERARLQRLVAQHERGEQVARGANGELQRTLAARQEEIASLRSDLGFYQRLMEGGAQRPGLSVHSLVLRATDDPRAFQYALTLSQNLKRNRQASGTVEMLVGGSRGAENANLRLDELGGGEAALEFSFKYFQQLNGLIMLPEGFKPASVRLRVQPEDGGNVEREFMWKDVIERDG